MLIYELHLQYQFFAKSSHLFSLYCQLWRFFLSGFSLKETFGSHHRENGGDHPYFLCQFHFKKQPSNLFYKKSVFKNFAKFTRKHLSLSLLLVLTCNFIKKDSGTPGDCFCIFSRTLRHLFVAILDLHYLMIYLSEFAFN